MASARRREERRMPPRNIAQPSQKIEMVRAPAMRRASGEPECPAKDVDVGRVGDLLRAHEEERADGGCEDDEKQSDDDHGESFRAAERGVRAQQWAMLLQTNAALARCVGWRLRLSQGAARSRQGSTARPASG